MLRIVYIAVFLALTAAGGGRPASTRPTEKRKMTEFTYDHGGIIRGPRDRKRIAPIFTGGDFGEGTGTILDALKARKIKASFFVTGDFLRKSEHQPLLKRIVAEGHYLGPHSDKHPLYCPWEDREKTLVTEEAFRSDLQKNIADLSKYGPKPEDLRFFIPPYEWYNDDISAWAKKMGIVLFNFTPGSRSNADWAPDDHKSFMPSQKIYESILTFEATQPDGLKGFLLLLHMGAGPGRTDKMHALVGKLFDELAKRGYEFVRVDEMLAPALKKQ